MEGAGIYLRDDRILLTAELLSRIMKQDGEAGGSAFDYSRLTPEDILPLFHVPGLLGLETVSVTSKSKMQKLLSETRAGVDPSSGYEMASEVIKCLRFLLFGNPPHLEGYSRFDLLLKMVEFQVLAAALLYECAGRDISESMDWDAPDDVFPSAPFVMIGGMVTSLVLTVLADCAEESLNKIREDSVLIEKAFAGSLVLGNEHGFPLRLIAGHGGTAQESEWIGTELAIRHTGGFEMWVQWYNDGRTAIKFIPHWNDEFSNAGMLLAYLIQCESLLKKHCYSLFNSWDSFARLPSKVYLENEKDFLKWWYSIKGYYANDCSNRRTRMMRELLEYENLFMSLGVIDSYAGKEEFNTSEGRYNPCVDHCNLKAMRYNLLKHLANDIKHYMKHYVPYSIAVELKKAVLELNELLVSVKSDPNDEFEAMKERLISNYVNNKISFKYVLPADLVDVDFAKDNLIRDYGRKVAVRIAMQLGKRITQEQAGEIVTPHKPRKARKTKK